MRVLSVSWNSETDKTKVHLNEDFASSDWIVRADILSDLVAEILDLYDKTKNEVRNPIMLETFGHNSSVTSLESVK